MKPHTKVIASLRISVKYFLHRHDVCLISKWSHTIYCLSTRNSIRKLSNEFTIESLLKNVSATKVRGGGKIATSNDNRRMKSSVPIIYHFRRFSFPFYCTQGTLIKAIQKRKINEILLKCLRHQKVMQMQKKRKRKEMVTSSRFYLLRKRKTNRMKINDFWSKSVNLLRRSKSADN